MAAIEHQMGEPTLEGSPLPYGEATRLNDLKRDTTPPAEGAKAGSQPNASAETLDTEPQGVNLNGAALDKEEQFSPPDEEYEALFGPTERPNEKLGTGGSPRSRRPDNLEKYLPALKKAAAEPDAPQELRDFMEILAYHLGRR